MNKYQKYKSIYDNANKRYRWRKQLKQANNEIVFLEKAIKHFKTNKDNETYLYFENLKILTEQKIYKLSQKLMGL